MIKDIKLVEKRIKELLNEADEAEQEAYELRKKAEAYQAGLDIMLETTEEVKGEMTYD